MANYPSYDMLLGSSIQQESGIEDDFAQSGAQHSRIFFAKDYFRFTLSHQLSLAQFTALKTTYDAGPRDVYTLSYLVESPLVTYSVKFTDPPAIVGNAGDNRFFVRCNLRGFKD